MKNDNTLFDNYNYALKEDTSVQNLKIGYILALFFVALITVMSQLFIRNALKNQESDANVVNTSGRQRFLSQQISKNVNILLLDEFLPNTPQTQAKSDTAFAELQKATDLWEKNHIALLKGDKNRNIPAISSPILLQMFVEMGENFDIMLQASKDLINAKSSDNFKNAKFKEILQKKADIILSVEKKFLQQMNKIVDRFALEAKEKIETLKWIELILMFVTFFVLFGEAMLIFRPITKKVNTYILDLKNTYEEVLTLSEELRQINEELFANNEALESFRVLIEKQNRELEIQHQSVMDSIDYAKHIQNAIMVEQEDIIQSFKGAFVLNIPKDVVSGDFYWFGKVNEYKIMILADCTGHGVAGAFMTMIGVTLLNEIIHFQGVTNPEVILANLDMLLKETLQQHQKIKNGMDIGIVVIDENNNQLTFAGARHNLYVAHKGHITQIKGASNSIDGIVYIEFPFVNHIFDIQKGDIFYLTSDGYRDQFGGEKGTKYLHRNFKNLLQEIHTESFFVQKEKLEAEHYRWRGDLEQTDDILIMGFQVI